MALMNLMPDEMLGVSGPMLDPKSEANAVILKYEDLSAPYKRLQVAHGRLSAAAQPAKAERVQEIIAAQAKFDLRHDTIIRGMWGFLTSLAELIGGDDGAKLIALRDLIVPDGLFSQNKTYGGEAGQAEQLALRMTVKVRKRTDAILLGEGNKAKTLTSYIDEWIELGRQLGTHEAERGRIENEPSEGAALHNSRLDWVRAQNAMLSNAEMAGLTQVEMAIVFGSLQMAERKADDRAREAKGKVAAELKAAGEKKAADEKVAEEKDAPEKVGPQGSGQNTG